MHGCTTGVRDKNIPFLCVDYIHYFSWQQKEGLDYFHFINSANGEQENKNKTNSIYIYTLYSQNELLQLPSPPFLVSLETQPHRISSSQLLLVANVPVDSYADCSLPHCGVLRCLVSQPCGANLASVFLVACVSVLLFSPASFCSLASHRHSSLTVTSKIHE